MTFTATFNALSVPLDAILDGPCRSACDRRRQWPLPRCRARLAGQRGHERGRGGNDSADGLRLAAELRPDVTLVDIDLGEESGFDLARKLMAADFASERKVILTSAYPEEDFAELIEDQSGYRIRPEIGVVAEHNYRAHTRTRQRRRLEPRLDASSAAFVGSQVLTRTRALFAGANGVVCRIPMTQRRDGPGIRPPRLSSRAVAGQSRLNWNLPVVELANRLVDAPLKRGSPIHRVVVASVLAASGPGLLRG